MRCVLICLSLAAFAQYSSDAALKTVWDVGDYVQDGIVMHYDGIRNVGADKPHDSAATQWVDLAPGGGYAINRPCVYGGSGTWSDKSYVATGTACMETVNQVALGANFTIQIACDLDVTSDDRTHPAIFGIGNDSFQIRMDRSYPGQQVLTNVHWKITKALTGGAHVMDFPWPKGQYINAGADDGHFYFTERLAWDECLNVWGMNSSRETVSIPEETYFIGGNPFNAGGRKYCTIGDYYSIRVYSRLLSEDELAWNRTIDEIRFYDADVLPYTNVVVASSAVPGAVGAEKPGVYVVDGAHVFTAAPITVGGNTYRPIGYSLETWDETASAWGEPVLYSQLEYTYTVAENQPKVRLTWHWRIEEGIERYDVHHYVQDGLIMHYDGIRNVGADKEHDSTATEWIDLSPNAGSAQNQACVYGGDGHWSDKSYVFTGVSCMRTTNKVAFGGEFTIQIVCDLDITSDDRQRPTLFCGDPNGDAMPIWMDRSWSGQQQLTNVFWTTDKYSGNTSGNRPQTEWKVGQYLNAAFDADYMYIMPGTDWSDCTQKWGMRQSRPTPVELPELTYTIGGRHVGGTSGERNYCTIGDYYAVRVYSRKLTNQELAYNRDIDEVRFHGAEPTWSNSVYVVSSRAEASGAETGAYRLIGEYTFTAPEKVVVGGEKLYVAGSVVESWNAAEKKWEKPVYRSGASRRLGVAESEVARRLTWKWSNMNHLLILVR